MAAAVFLALCAPAFAGTSINLSPDGDDATADGSEQKPFASLKAAMEFAEKSGGSGKSHSNSRTERTNSRRRQYSRRGLRATEKF